MKLGKKNCLQQALTTRRTEIAEYQINIDNYTRAIAKIDAMVDPTDDMKLFHQQLTELLASEKAQQARCALLAEVISDQIEDPA